jgi:hypothetical protein
MLAPRCSVTNTSSLVVAITFNGMRGWGIERCNGWLSGKNSEGRNPTGGSGVK